MSITRNSRAKTSRYMKGLVMGLLALSIGSAAQAASYQFTWTGSDGYKLEGALSISNSLAQAKHVDQTAIECFWIQGYRGEALVGRWSIGQLTPKTSWSLSFEPQASQFRTGGQSSTGAFGQAWNMNGTGRGCGIGGFGFNVGGAAQDICINNKLVRSSQMPPETPLKAMRNDKIKFSPDDCGYVQVS